MYLEFLMPARQKFRNPAPHSSRTLLRGGSPAQKTFQKISLGFANPPPAKLLRKTESAFVFAHSVLFLWKSSVLRTEAL